MAYANPNYDSIKAHEYYEKHKKLKGRHSIKGMSDSQKATWSYAKSQLQDQKKAKNQAISDDRQNKLERLTEESKQVTANKIAVNSALSETQKAHLEKLTKAKQMQKKQLATQAQGKCKALQKKLSRMNPNLRKLKRDQIQKTIKSVRDKLSKAQSLLESQTKSKKEDVRSGIASQKQTNKDYAAQRHEQIKGEKAKVREEAKAAKEKNKADYDSALDKAYNRVKGGK